MTITANLWYKSSLKLPLEISFLRSLFVADTILTLTDMDLSPPTLVILFSCSALSTLACALKLISPISSKKSVPLFANSNLPALSLCAPVNDPLVCPKSSDSINSEGIAAQFTSTIGPSFRLLLSCIHLATNSLPVPLGPWTNTRASVGATFSIVSLSTEISEELPTILVTGAVFLTLLWSFFFCTIKVDLSSAFLTVINNLLRSGGLAIKSKAPFFTASTAVSISP